LRVRGDEELLATRDGLPLQRIYSRTTEFGEPLKAAKKAVTKDMPPEKAEIVRDELASGGADKPSSREIVISYSVASGA
jgi:hypothetical protein